MQVGREGIEPLVSHPTIEDSGFTDHRGEHNPEGIKPYEIRVFSAISPEALLSVYYPIYYQPCQSCHTDNKKPRSVRGQAGRYTTSGLKRKVMHMADSTKKTRRKKVSKPPKPYPEFPLTPHNGGSWMKKINGTIFYFGKWGKVVKGKMERLPGDGWREALDEYKASVDIIRRTGRKPVTSAGDGLSLKDLCNKFLTAKLRKKSAGELSHRTFLELNKTTDGLIEAFGKDRLVSDIGPEDFEGLRAEIAAKWGPVRLSNEITRIKSVFLYAFKNDLIEKPVRYGSEFEKPGKEVLRRHKNANGKKMIEAEIIRKLIKAAEPPLKAMILLGINCGFGNTDCGNLQQSMIQGEWIDFPRPKTGIERRNPLWPETIEAMKAAIAMRPAPINEADGDCVFLTPFGRWVRPSADSITDNVTARFRGLAQALGVHRKGVAFYSLRHTFQTIADQARDPIATKFLMGHTDASMSGTYREFVSDENLVRVSNHVRQWLFREGGAK